MCIFPRVLTFEMHAVRVADDLKTLRNEYLRSRWILQSWFASVGRGGVFDYRLLYGFFILSVQILPNSLRLITIDDLGYVVYLVFQPPQPEINTHTAGAQRFEI